MSEAEIIMVFKYHDPVKDATIVEEMKKQGYEIITENDDRFYFASIKRSWQ